MSSGGSHVLPVAIVGAGPVGLAAAAHLIARRIPVRLYEAGETVAAHVRDWGHVRLFSPWRFNVDAMAKSLLFDHGWREPAGDVLPTGQELHDGYLKPLAATAEIAAITETGARVRSIARQGIDKVVSRDRAIHPFALAIETAGGGRLDLARAVIDASGTWSCPNPLGANGIPAHGEAALSSRIVYGVPDVLGREYDAYAGGRVLVIGGGHSAANVVLDLARLAERNSGTRVVWAVRSQSLARIFGGGEADKLPARGQLGSDLKRLVESGNLKIVTGFSAERVRQASQGVIVSGRVPSGDTSLEPVDRVIVCTGQRPDLEITRELRLDLDPWLESPRALAPMIDPNLHSCGSVPPHGYRELAHAEPDFFTVGIKSYGRAPTFLMATGYEQVRSVTAHLAGDHAAADDVRLVLPETGVCSASIAAAPKSDAGCCGGPARDNADACYLEDAIGKSDGKAGVDAGLAPLRPQRKAEPRMPETPYNVLFLCTGNSARSIIAEAILNKAGGGKFRAYSAGSHPKGAVNPYTLELLVRLSYDTSGLRSKSWAEFARADAPKLDFVFTVCDDAAGETCPVWPGQPMTAHWGIPDPAAAIGSPAEIAVAFNDAHRMLSQRIGAFAALPLAALDNRTLKARLRDIGHMAGATGRIEA